MVVIIVGLFWIKLYTISYFLYPFINFIKLLTYYLVSLSTCFKISWRPLILVIIKSIIVIIKIIIISCWIFLILYHLIIKILKNWKTKRQVWCILRSRLGREGAEWTLSLELCFFFLKRSEIEKDEKRERWKKRKMNERTSGASKSGDHYLIINCFKVINTIFYLFCSAMAACNVVQCVANCNKIKQVSKMNKWSKLVAWLI